MTTEHPPRPPRDGYYWQLDAAGWREVRPINWFWLAQYQLRIERQRAVQPRREEYPA